MTTAISPDQTQGGGATLCLSGYGIDLRVDHGALVARDGIADRRREYRIRRADRTTSRILMLGTTGEISLSALRWCTDVGIALTVLDPFSGEVLALNSPTVYDDARLRRAQAKAADSDRGLRIARDLVAAKVLGQRGVMRELFGDATALEHLDRYLTQIEPAPTMESLRYIEANAAVVYFKGWQGLPVTFAPKAKRHIPPYWLAFERRSSTLGDGKVARSAADPVNAMLNLAYILLYVEAVRACHALGLDPGLGIMHRDKMGRDSLACDLVEPVRPIVDRYILNIVRSTVFTRDDFVEMRSGQCRVGDSMAAEIAAQMPAWAKALAPHAESVAHQIVDGSDGSSRRRTPLTGNPKKGSQRKSTPRRATPMRTRCIDCGESLTDRRQHRCPKCRDATQMQTLVDRLAAAQARLEAVTDDPNATGAVRRAAKASVNRSEASLWDLQHPGAERDPEHLRTKILPGLQGVPVPTIMDALGITYDAAWRIRRGDLTPHPRHWPPLLILAKHRVNGEVGRD